MPVLKTRVKRLEKDNGNGVPLATIPTGATIEEATRIFGNNLKSLRLRQIEISTERMSLEEATKIFKCELRVNPTNTTEGISATQTKT